MVKRGIKIVLDTNIFINPDSRYLFGNTPRKALVNFLDMLQEIPTIKCYMPPSIYEELTKFLVGENLPDKIILIQRKPPSCYETSIPALLFYEFLEEMRIRINKGLRIGEKYIRKALSHKDEEHLIKNLREEYRTALREGIIDSRQDFDLILLSKELQAYLATTDNGLIHWATKLGISCLNPDELKNFLVYPSD